MDFLQFDKIKDDFRTFLRDAGKEIYDLLKDQRAKVRFLEQIERFMRMREGHLLKFNELVKKARKLKKSVKVPDDLPPEPLGWYKIPTYSPGSKSTCELYGVIFPASYQQRKPTEQDLLMLYYVKLAVIYDLAYARTFGTPKLYFDAEQMLSTAAGWGNRENIAWGIWCKMTRYEGISKDASAIEEEYIENALEAVRADLKLLLEPTQDSKKTRVDQIIDEALLSPAELANHFIIPKNLRNLFRKRLERLRRRDSDCFTEVADPKPREARFLYRLSVVRPIVDAITKKSI